MKFGAPQGRPVKYEDIYLRDYHDGCSLHAGLGKDFNFYNHERLHSSLDKQTPAQVYAQKG